MAIFHRFGTARGRNRADNPEPADQSHPTNAGQGRTEEGLVLSGGGSRGSFHLGALRYLYDHRLIAPTTIVSTSAGSIFGLLMSQSADPAEQSRYLRLVESYWMAMTTSGDMFAEQAWFTNLREQWEELVGAMPDLSDSEPVFVDANTDDAEGLVREVLQADPSREPDPFSLSALWKTVGTLGRISRIGPGLATSLRGAERASSAYRPGPIVQRVLYESGFSAQTVAGSGMRLRMAMVGLNSGDLRYMRQDGIIVDMNDQPVDDTPFDLSLGLYASCAIPGVFRPVRLGDEMYVDGGMRDNIPVHMCVTGLGVTRPYVISCLSLRLPRADYLDKDVVAVVGRSMAIMVDETTRDELAWSRQMGATVIEPLIDVHSILTVEPGLLRINRDYGWMRAAEVMTGAPDGMTGPIVKTRLALYRLLAKPRADPAEAEITEVRARLGALVAAADPALLPEESAGWADETWGAPVR